MSQAGTGKILRGRGLGGAEDDTVLDRVLEWLREQPTSSFRTLFEDHPRKWICLQSQKSGHLVSYSPPRRAGDSENK